MCAEHPMTEEETLARYSTASLRRNVLGRAAKRLIMEFDSQYDGMKKEERDEFLDLIYPKEEAMTKTDVIKMIDDHKNRMIDPTAMLHWTWLRVIINQIPDEDWERYVGNAVEVMSR